MDIKEPYGFIYITTNMINGKRYIGQKLFFKGKPWKKYLGSGKALKKSIEKYGATNFIRDIVAIAYDKKELDYLEMEFIKNYDAIKSNNFYNIAKGGDGGDTYAGKSKDDMILLRNKLSESSKGVISPNKGKHLSKEWKENISKTLKGRKLNDEWKNKIGISNKGKTREDMRRENNPKSKKVICVTTNKIFNVIKDGALYYKCSSSGISNCCRGIYKSCGKLENGTRLIWQYYDEWLIKPKSKNIKIGRWKKVICLNTGKTFENSKIAGDYYRCHNTSIIACCKHKLNCCGQYNGEKLKWMYYDEYYEILLNETKDYEILEDSENE